MKPTFDQFPFSNQNRFNRDPVTVLATQCPYIWILYENTDNMYFFENFTSPLRNRQIWMIFIFTPFCSTRTPYIWILYENTDNMYFLKNYTSSVSIVYGSVRQWATVGVYGSVRQWTTVGVYGSVRQCIFSDFQPCYEQASTGAVYQSVRQPEMGWSEDWMLSVFSFSSFDLSFDRDRYIEANWGNPLLNENFALYMYGWLGMSQWEWRNNGSLSQSEWETGLVIFEQFTMTDVRRVFVGTEQQMSFLMSVWRPVFNHRGTYGGWYHCNAWVRAWYPRTALPWTCVVRESRDVLIDWLIRALSVWYRKKYILVGRVCVCKHNTSHLRRFLIERCIIDQ